MRSATLELITKANGKKTGDELVAEMNAKRKQELEEDRQRVIAEKVAGTFRSAKERRKLRLVMENGERMETPNA